MNMDRFNINCKMCKKPFSKNQQAAQPRVLPCGHTVCLGCIENTKNLGYELISCPYPSCRQEFQVHILRPPVNHLYEEMMVEFDQYIRNKDWQEQKFKGQDNEQKNDAQQIIGIEFKCLYTFCHRLRYEKNGVRQVFCSPKCMELNQALYSAQNTLQREEDISQFRQ